MSTAQEQADLQRAEAKRILTSALIYICSGATVDRIVDCIIAAAVLETAAIQEEAMKVRPIDKIGSGLPNYPKGEEA